MQGSQSLKSNEEAIFLIALLSIKGLGSATARKIIQSLGSAKNFFNTSTKQLAQLKLKPSIINAQQKLSKTNLHELNSVIACLKWLQKENNRHIITLQNPYYPLLLKQISNPPALLFAQGSLDLLATPQIAVVGTRSPTASGLTNTQQFCQSLVESGFTITSGLAVGVDGEAHRSALAVGGNTIAVMGTGPDRVYPAHHRELAHQIAEKGLLLSERLPNTPFDAGAFPQRNRIIAGLSLGTLVIEAAEKSGTLITANLSVENGREVYAIPGSIHNAKSKGCHKLIKQGAKLVESLEDIIEDLPYNAKMGVNAVNVKDDRDKLNEQDTQFLNYIDYEITSIDTIVNRSQLTVDTVTNKLLNLELQGWVINSAGGYIRQ